MYLLNKLVRSTLWRTVSAASKTKLANALASGNTQAIIVSSRIAAAQAAQPSEEEEALPYRQATAERQQ